MIKSLTKKIVGVDAYNRLAIRKAKFKSYFEVLADSRRREIFNGVKKELARPDYEYLRSPDDEDIQIAEEIVENYHQCMEDLKSSGEVYKPSEYWTQSLNQTRKFQRQLLMDRRSQVFAFLLCNIRRNVGNKFAPPFPKLIHDNYYFTQYIHKTVNTFDYLTARYPHLKNEPILNEPEVGNPIPIKIGNVSTSHYHLQQVGYSEIIKERFDLRLDEPLLFVEIGAGAGNLGRIMLKRYPNSKYVILDLPLISNGPLYLLRKSFPGKQVVSWSRFRETPDLDSGDIFVLPNFAIEKLSRPENGRKVIFINTHSLGEMNDEISTNYMRHVDRLCDAAFTINRKKGKKRIQEVDMDVYSLLEVGKDWQKVHMGPSMPECKLGEWLAGYWEESVVKTARA